jgi:hypothetical protein
MISARCQHRLSNVGMKTVRMSAGREQHGSVLARLQNPQPIEGTTSGCCARQHGPDRPQEEDGIGRSEIADGEGLDLG